MKYITFYRENNDFSDILNDTQIKKLIDTKISWYQYLMVGFSESQLSDQVISIITLKYGDEIKSHLTKDYSPIPNVDYIREVDTTKYKQVIS